ncbi:aminoacyl-tRNA deacylase [Candidatus Peregrinibacteria bacterium CG10_big_fil_rev_8_21_14_0_10_49_16]|nr:MAG: aminoacyl-tRNA deacylase [Candidatus Peregrinibacteria bacterium CG22_combo_CG10-13_8_21_14_all_49_11]PIR52170.1 MAG: aminoacyl-tRNA deacylase [Candidatus Peregrinibacteria bacterium CG10_big_fil_rev_8_21_14_0_10_49_16]
MQGIESFLQQHNIPFQRFNHPAVFTCEESEKLCPAMPGMHTKNLFLRDEKKKRFILLSVPHGKRVDLAQFGKMYGVKKPSLANADYLKQYLGVEPGAVTLLGLINDVDHNVEVVLDEELWKYSEIGCHPLVNTATFVIKQEDMEKFFGTTGHEFHVYAIPERQGH